MISALLLIVTIILSKTKKIGSMIPPKVLKIVIVVEIVGIIATVGEYATNILNFDNTVTRPSVGEGDIEEELKYETEDKTTDITLEVPAMLHDTEEKESLIEKAKEEKNNKKEIASPYTESKEDKKSKIVLILGIIIVVILVCGYFIMSHIRKNDFQDDNITYVIRR